MCTFVVTGKSEKQKLCEQMNEFDANKYFLRLLSVQLDVEPSSTVQFNFQYSEYGLVEIDKFIFALQ